MTYLITCIVFRALLKILLKFKVIGRENLPKKGPFIVASNHVSHIDPAVVGVACSPFNIRFIARKNLFDIPILGLWMRAVGCIATERNSGGFRTLKKALQKLKDGETLGIFPEGTRSLDGRPQKSEPGIGLLAFKSGAPVIPVYVSGTDKALPRGKKLLRLCKVTAKIGRVVDIGESAKFSGKRKIYESIGEKVMNAILSLKNA